MDNRIIFLGGCPRSGTTLVQNMLDSHPEVLGGPEFLHIPDIIQLREKLLASVRRGWIDLICSAPDVDRQMRNLIESLLLPFADRHGARLLSEKTPENVLAFPKLVELFPDAKFVHVVRDPRAVVASLLSVGERARSKGEKPAPFTVDAHAAVRYAKRCLDAGFGATRVAPQRVHTLVYEKLVAAPEGEGRSLCNFLGLSWVPAMIRPADHAHLGEAAATVNSKEIWYDTQTYNSNPNTASVDKWRSALSPTDLIIIERALRSSSDLAELGYDLSTEALSPVRKVVASMHVAARSLRSTIGARARAAFLRRSAGRAS